MSEVAEHRPWCKHPNLEPLYTVEGVRHVPVLRKVFRATLVAATCMDCRWLGWTDLSSIEET